MNRLLKIFLLWMLIFALPVQGFAATMKISCGPAHQQTRSGEVMSSNHMHDELAASNQHEHHEHVQTDAYFADTAAATEVSTDAAEYKSPHESAFCSACAACCAGAAAPPSAMNWPAVFSSAEAVTLLPVPLVTGFIPAGLERPPKHISA